MKRETFIELTGENPEDVLGNDWENEVEELSDGSERLGLLKGIPPESTFQKINKGRKLKNNN